MLELNYVLGQTAAEAMARKALQDGIVVYRFTLDGEIRVKVVKGFLKYVEVMRNKQMISGVLTLLKTSLSPSMMEILYEITLKGHYHKEFNVPKHMLSLVGVGDKLASHVKEFYQAIDCILNHYDQIMDLEY